MPFKSEAQRKKFLQLVKEGKMPQSTFDKWQSETPDKLPEKLGATGIAKLRNIAKAKLKK